MCVTIFNTGGKFRPVSILHSYTLLLFVARSYVLLASIIESKFPLIILTQFVPVFGLFQPLKLKCTCTGTLGPQPWHIDRIFSQVASLINHIINKGTLSHLSRPNTKAFSETEMCPTLMPYRIVENFRGRKLSRILQFCGYLRKFSP